MNLHRLRVKSFVTDPEAVDLAAMTGVFHRWIRDGALPDLMIDVANYRHVHQGPGVILIGDTFDCALDMADGRPGLSYVRKRRRPDADRDLLAPAFQGALRACRLLEAEQGLARPIRFGTDVFTVSALDRLAAPNGDTGALLRDRIASFVQPLFEPGQVRVEPVDGDARQPITFRIQVTSGPALAALEQRAGAAAARSA